MASVNRLLLLRRIYVASSSFHRHALFTKPPISSSSSPIPYYNTSLSLFRHFSSSSNHHTNEEGTHFGNDEFNIAILGTGVYDDSILPVRVLISLLDSFHNLTGLPWWMVIASSTLVMRLALFPVAVLQLRKLRRIGELLPKLPSPIWQFKLFLKESEAVGCPSLFWFAAGSLTQLPAFLLWITSIRKMSLEHHPGFECGGTLWLQNLTEYANGALGPVVPLIIAFLHYANVQISFQKSSLGETPGLLADFAKYFKYSMEFLTLPILFATFNVPQGSLIFWVTNSSLSIVQKLALKHPTLFIKLGLPPLHKESSKKELGEKSSLEEKRKLVSVKDLSPLELVNGSLIYLSKGNKDRALPLLRLAIQKDPEYGRALIVMGQILLSDGLNTEALQYFERVVSGVSLSGSPVRDEDMHDLLLSTKLCGVAYARENNYDKAIANLQRIASLEEPEDPKGKVPYYEGLLLLCSALYHVGQKAEAAQYAHRLAAYDSKYNYLIQQIEEDEFVNDIVTSRRGDL